MADSRPWLVLAGLTVTGLLLYLLSPVLTPFLFAAVLAYLGDPMVDRLEAWKLPRSLAVTIVFLVLTTAAVLVLLIVVPMLQRQIVLLLQKIPTSIDWLQQVAVPWLELNLGIDTKGIDLESLKAPLQAHWQDAGKLVTGMLDSITRSGLALLGWLANLVLIPVVTFYLLRDWDVLVAHVRELLPRRVEPVVSHLAKESDEVLSAFFRGQLLVMLALATIYSVGLRIVGLELALLIGILAGLVSFVPYLGFFVGIVVASIAALMQFHDPVYVVYIAIVFAIGQAIEGMVLTPLLVGDRIGLHPVAVIFAVMAGAQLFGFFGVLLALPVSALIMVLLRYAHSQYKRSDLYSGEAGTP